MSREAAEGLASAYALFEAVPTAAQQELVVELGIIGREVLAIQRQGAPHDTGELAAGLSFQLLIDRLRVRIGLLGVKAGRAKLFYGRIVEFGRRAQTVLVQRRRRVGGLLRTSSRGSRKRASDISATYSLRVKALAPRPYVNPAQPDLDDMAAQQLANFWSNTMDRAGAGS